MKKLWRDRRGNALIIAAGAMPLVFGAAGLASDTIQWTLWKRQLQRAADSAAIAGVYGLVQGQTKTDAVTRDLQYNSHLKTSPTVSYPSPASPYATDAMAVRVQLGFSKRLNFSSMFISSPPTITADATATIVPDGKYCVISLESGDVTGIDATGSTTVNLGCGGKTNSTSMSAAVATGSSLVKMTPVAAVGGIPASTHWGNGTVLQPFSLAQADPFINVPPPTPSGCQTFAAMVAANGGSKDFSTSRTSATSVYCIKETGGNPDFQVQGDVNLGKGTYVLDGTDLSMSATNASLTCSGCTIVLTSSTAATDPGSIGNVHITGGKLNLTSPEAGNTYAGIAIYQDRRATAYNDNIFNGNGASALEGALYFPNGDLTFAGTTGQSTSCLQLVGRRITFTGNSNIQNNCTGAGGGNSFEGKKVRLVA
ncbi:MAG: pilus assembly protein TadG-related protein [Sphingomicrobium sp.]